MLRPLAIATLTGWAGCAPCAPADAPVRANDAGLARVARRALRSFQAAAAVDICVASVRVREGAEAQVRASDGVLDVRAPTLRLAEQATTEGLCQLALAERGEADVDGGLAAWCGLGPDALALLGPWSCGSHEEAGRLARDLVYLPDERLLRRFTYAADATLPGEVTGWRGGEGAVLLVAEGEELAFDAFTGAPIPLVDSARRLPVGLPLLLPRGWQAAQRDAWSWARTTLVAVTRDAPGAPVRRYVWAEGTDFLPVAGLCPQVGDAAFPLDDALWLGRPSSVGAMWGGFSLEAAP